MALAFNLSSALMLTILIYVFSFQCSCSNEAEIHHTLSKGQLPKRQKGYVVDLIRRDSPFSPLSKGKNLTISERLQKSIKRSNARWKDLQHRTKRIPGNYYSPVSAGEGEFITQINVGFPVPLKQHVIVDTGSDLLWVQCQRCQNCLNQTDTIYNPQQSFTYSNVSCRNAVCADVGKCDKQNKSCNYFYAYGDFSFTEGVVAYETFSFKRVFSRALGFIPGVVFGCGFSQGGFFSNVDGILGLGRGPLSLISQLGSSTDYKFSYCLGPWDSTTGVSSLFIGNLAVVYGRNVKSTPLIHNKYRPTFYYVNLEGIRVAGKAIIYPKNSFVLQPNNGTGGLIVDSGTTITYLENGAYIPFVNAVRSIIHSQPVGANSSLLDLCYKSNAIKMAELPSITFEFAGKATFELPPMNNFIKLNDTMGNEQICLAYTNAGAVEDGAFSIFGNIQQQNYNIGYDVRRNTFSFAPANCDKR